MQFPKSCMRKHGKKVFAALLLTAYLLINAFFQHYITIYSHVFRGIKYLTSPRWTTFIPGTHLDCVVVLSTIKNGGTQNVLGLQSPKLSHPNFWELLTQQLDRQGTNTAVLCEKTQTTKNGKLYDVTLPSDFDFDLTLPLNNVSLTSASKSYFFVENESVITVGDIINVVIVTRDIEGKDTAHAGGDFFKVSAETKSIGASIAASDVTYLGKGVYLAKIITRWVGPHHIKVLFGQSGHYVGLIAGVTATKNSPSMVWNAEYKSFLKRNQSRCGIVPIKTSRVQCNYTNHNGEGWYCVKPDGLSCKDMKSMHLTRKTTVLGLLRMFPIEDRGTMIRKYIKAWAGSSIVDVEVIPQAGIPFKYTDGPAEQPRCYNNKTINTPFRNANPAGYWMHNTWKSLACRNYPFTANLKQRNECLRNRQIFLFGDSTIRQWFDYFLKDETDPTSPIRETTPYVDVWEPRSALNDKLNLSITFRTHGFPLIDGGLVSSFRFISNELDGLPKYGDDGNRTTVAIAFGPHLYLYSPVAIANRLNIIREAANRLLARNGKITIIFKGPTTFTRLPSAGEFLLSDWLAYRFHLIAKEFFDGTAIKYLDVWDMSLSHRGMDALHPDQEAVRNQIDMALSFSCVI